MTVSIIVPVYNERDTITVILDRIDAVDLGFIKKEIIIVDDGSTDGTRDILLNLCKQNVKTVFLEKNSGKGTAIRAGLKEATGEIVIIQDADLEYDPNDYHRLIEPIIKKRADIVYGSRWLGGQLNDIPWTIFKCGTWVLTFLANILYRANISDEPTGYKVFRTEVIKGLNLRCKGFEFCPEVTAKARKAGYDIFEVPISYHPRTVKQGKKIGLKDGIIAVYELLKYKFI